jgi:hypothetical protein
MAGSIYKVKGVAPASWRRDRLEINLQFCFTGRLSIYGRPVFTFRDFDTGGLVPPLSYFQDDHRATTQTKILRIENGRLDPVTDYIDVGRDDTYFEI